MNTLQFRRAFLPAFALSSFFLLPCSLFPQGTLTPPGAPAPTMKTLDQVEARTPLAGGTSPLGVGSGSYYLTGNLNISTSANGITVSGSNVTIDLNGFTLTGSSSGSGSGIFLSGGFSNVTIVNGTIRNWGSHGINALGNPNLRAEKLRVISNGGNGIAADLNCEVVNCIADSNVGYGIQGTDNCLVKDCQVTGSTGVPGDGIVLGQAALVTGCVASGNIGNGIKLTSGAAKDCTTNNNGGNGISASIVEHCTALQSGSSGFGIYATTASNCYCRNTGVGEGLYATNASNCFGYTTGTGTGINATNASNCYGFNSGSGIGLASNGIAIGCYGYSATGFGLSANIANSCLGQTSTGTAQSITNKYNMP